MRILTYCDVEVGDIAKRLGTPEYSYHFVHESFIGALTKFADVKRVYSAHEANALWVESSARRENCVLLSFAPPNKTLMDLECPTIPVFAWEYPQLAGGSGRRQLARRSATRLADGFAEEPSGNHSVQSYGSSGA
jgi:hypothetical protein